MLTPMCCHHSHTIITVHTNAPEDKESISSRNAYSGNQGGRLVFAELAGFEMKHRRCRCFCHGPSTSAETAQGDVVASLAAFESCISALSENKLIKSFILSRVSF